MTVCLREQQQKLINDKKYLADSLADISHQIRTPLTSINLLVERLSASGLTDECRHQLTNELYELLDRIDWLITTLLKISKLDAGTVSFNKETVSLESLIKRSCSPLLIPVELRGQELILRAEGDFYGDPAWTSEAVGNIVKNCKESDIILCYCRTYQKNGQKIRNQSYFLPDRCLSFLYKHHTTK